MLPWPKQGNYLAIRYQQNVQQILQYRNYVSPLLLATTAYEWLTLILLGGTKALAATSLSAAVIRNGCSVDVRYVKSVCISAKRDSEKLSVPGE